MASLGRHRVVPRPETCRSWIIQRGPHVRCDFPLAQAPAVRLSKDGPVLAAQHAVDAFVLADHRDTAARQRGGELCFLGRRALRGIHTRLDAAPAVVREILDEYGGARPRVAAKQEVHDAHNVAVGTALAVIATDLEHPCCEELFAWLHRTPGRPVNIPREHPTSNLSNWKPAGSRVTSRILAASDGALAENAIHPGRGPAPGLAVVGLVARFGAPA
ncbi:hypothetical protein [Streptomyces milbemycinicus]|uniref:hypothetical protein n=1 Tax=Streptomyces milbemycinicus TaxID=476552 RepID=UPI0033E3184D